MSIFRLQQFSIEQSQSGMKVCSDSLLFGAMIPINGAKRIMDIGTGTGILALMQAQKVHSSEYYDFDKIIAVELTQAAAEEARKNFKASPWASSIELVEQDIQGFAKKSQATQQAGYDLIICNPPFFVDHSRTKSSDELRALARHTDTLSYEDLCSAMANLLATDGNIFVLLPTVSIESFSEIAKLSELAIVEITEISETEGHASKVAMIRLAARVGCLPAIIPKNIVYKFDENHTHTAVVKEYLADYLLRYGK